MSDIPKRCQLCDDKTSTEEMFFCDKCKRWVCWSCYDFDECMCEGCINSTKENKK